MPTPEVPDPGACPAGVVDPGVVAGVPSPAPLGVAVGVVPGDPELPMPEPALVPGLVPEPGFVPVLVPEPVVPGKVVPPVVLSSFSPEPLLPAP